MFGLLDFAVRGSMLMAESAIPKWYGLRLWRNESPGIISTTVSKKTEDNWTGRLTSRVWNCLAYNRQELQYRCHEQGLIRKKELWYSSVHQRLGIGGICVEIERQRVDSEEFRRNEQHIPVQAELSGTPVVSHILLPKMLQTLWRQERRLAP